MSAVCNQLLTTNLTNRVRISEFYCSTRHCSSTRRPNMSDVPSSSRSWEWFFVIVALVSEERMQRLCWPNHQRRHAKWKLSSNVYTLHTRFCTLGADSYAQSVLINKISASELSRKFVKAALLVGLRVLARR